eukprot:CAMPEP_0113523592 /NCGR_PEP_ID=MMETSP0014_2-20120614/45784_1 /TAXON_ID=2857 /ORGANISM="Nitzschia sp." /LENGTH=847 /DNA_ID=CAMNT_0000421685 /DNA_START=206 /DNA_END=2749 /DNA_ORIENTATION=- /assembly_acc=CAM_ASM_000159
MVFGRRAGEIQSTGVTSSRGGGGGVGEKKKKKDDGEDEKPEPTAAPVAAAAGAAAAEDDTIVDDTIVVAEEEEEEPSPVTDLLGLDTSAISLDGQSLVVPVEQINVLGHISYDDSDEFETAYEGDCVSSLGTGKYTYGGPPGVTTTTAPPPPPNGGGNDGSRNNFGASIGYIGDMRIIQQPHQHHHHSHHHSSTTSDYYDANDANDADVGDGGKSKGKNPVVVGRSTSAAGKKLPRPPPKTDIEKNTNNRNSSRHSRRSARSSMSSNKNKPTTSSSPQPQPQPPSSTRQTSQDQTQTHTQQNDVSYCTTIGEDYSVRDVENGTSNVPSGAGGFCHDDDDNGDSMSYANSSIGNNNNNNNTAMADVELNNETATSPTTTKSLQQQNKDNTVMKKTKKNKKKPRTSSTKSKDATCGCVPSWLTNAPYWLKMVIVGSLALLVGAIVLIGVGAWFAANNDNDNGGSGSNGNTNGIGSSNGGGSTVPALPTTTSPPPPADDEVATIGGGQPEQEQQPSIPEDDDEEGAPGGAGADTGEGDPTNPTTATSASQNVSTNPPISRPTTPSSTVSFYVMGGRFEDEGLTQLTTDLAQLPVVTTGTTTEPNYPVLFHLGDWNSPFSTSCDQASFQSNVDTYRQSTVPVYFVPGDNEFNDCPDPEQAIGFWYNSLLDFESRYWPAPSWNVTRQLPDNAENFSFVQDRVLFVGMNLVGGFVHDQREWDNRHSSNLAWVDQAVTENSGNFDVVVVLGHSDPDIEVNENFFNRFFELVQTFEEHVFFVHRNLGIDTWQFEPARDGMANVDVIVVEGSAWPPMFIEIDVANRSLTIDQGSWFDDYVSSGELAFSSTALTSGF